MKKLNYYLVILFSLLLLACRTDENEGSKIENQYKPINAFVNFEKQIKFQKSSEINYAYPFAEIISNFINKTPEFKENFEKEYGKIDLSLASQTFGENNKYNIFPIIKKGHVSSLLICEVNADRTYARFKVLDSRTPKLNIKEIIDSFEAKFSAKSNRINTTAREVAIEEIIITVYYDYYIYWSSGSSGSGTSGGGNMDGDGTIHGSGGSGGSDVAPIIISPDTPIANIVNFLKCLNVNSSAKLTIYCNQPIPNSSASHDGTFVGHTFISIQQGGQTKVIGFYPQSNWISPINSSSAGVYGNDSGEDFNVSVSKDISASQLQSIMNYIYNSAGSTYNLNTYNCTDFGIAVGNKANMNLPDAYGTWPGGGGSNPGALGQYMRTMSGNGVTVKASNSSVSAPNSTNCN